MAPEIDGPWRGWYVKQHLSVHNIFTENETVWWTHKDPAYPQPPPGTYGIDEVQSKWVYQPQGGGPALVLSHTTYNQERYGQFIFPASFLLAGQYVIRCEVFNLAGVKMIPDGSWIVTVA